MMVQVPEKVKAKFQKQLEEQIGAKEALAANLARMQEMLESK